MSKYIIEIEEKPLCVFDKDTQTYFPRLWRVKGFNSLVFDEDGLSRLEVLNSDYINEHFGDLQDTAYQKGINDGSLDVKQRVEGAYQRGLDDAWEAARKLFSSMADSDIEKAFPTEWNNGGFNALINLQPQEAIERLKAYEEKQTDKIKVGDVVMIKQFKHPENHLFVVTKVSDESVWGVEGDGSWNYWAINEVIKTDKHFDIASILEDMRND